MNAASHIFRSVSFPTPQKDEHVLSTAWRYSIISRYSSFKKSLDIFELDGVRLGPTNLGIDVIDQMSNFVGNFTSKHDLVRHHSLIPYYRPFYTDNDWKHEAPVKVSRTLKSNRNWRWCSVCCENDINTIGYSYFRTHHQLPSVSKCHQHGIPLSGTCPNCKLEWLCIEDMPSPDKNTCHRCGHNLTHENTHESSQHWLDSVSRELLSTSLEEPIVEAFRQALRKELDIGEVGARLTVSQKMRINDFNTHVNERLGLDLLNSLFSNCKLGIKGEIVNPNFSASRTAYGQTKEMLPIYYLLIFKALFGEPTVENLKSAFLTGNSSGRWYKGGQGA